MLLKEQVVRHSETQYGRKIIDLNFYTEFYIDFPFKLA